MEIGVNLGAATASTYGIGRAGNTPVRRVHFRSGDVEPVHGEKRQSVLPADERRRDDDSAGHLPATGSGPKPEILKPRAPLEPYQL